MLKGLEINKGIWKNKITWNLQIPYNQGVGIRVDQDMLKALYKGFEIKGKKEVVFKDHTYTTKEVDCLVTDEGYDIYTLHQDGEENPIKLIYQNGDYYTISGAVNIEYADCIEDIGYQELDMTWMNFE